MSKMITRRDEEQLQQTIDLLADISIVSRERAEAARRFGELCDELRGLLTCVLPTVAEAAANLELADDALADPAGKVIQLRAG